ncbi:MAG: 30S ribosome-binding factor RbfA [Gammaproteobacteria bacterium]|jgi:ribosome-binding factor A|nr:30S ribosome-binding factor RbfA [Gammaproteobacteria bacterium]
MSRASQRGFDRGERIGAALLRELTQLLRRAKDPRLGDITLHEVRVSRDLAHAKVYFTCFPADKDASEQGRLLNGGLSGFLRHELARTARLRTVPQLHFVHDESVRRGERLSALIESAVGQAADSHDTETDTTGGDGHRADEAADASNAGR